MQDGASCSLPENELVVECLNISENLFMVALYCVMMFVFFVVPLILLFDSISYRKRQNHRKNHPCMTGSTASRTKSASESTTSTTNEWNSNGNLHS